MIATLLGIIVITLVIFGVVAIVARATLGE